jgi:hypothetical protein
LKILLTFKAPADVFMILEEAVAVVEKAVVNIKGSVVLPKGGGTTDTFYKGAAWRYWQSASSAIPFYGRRHCR